MLYAAENPAHSVYNIATGVATSVGRVAELAQQYSQFDVGVEMGPGMLMQRCEALDIARARNELGYVPQYDVETGIQQYAEWMKKAI